MSLRGSHWTPPAQRRQSQTSRVNAMFRFTEVQFLAGRFGAVSIGVKPGDRKRAVGNEDGQSEDDTRVEEVDIAILGAERALDDSLREAQIEVGDQLDQLSLAIAELEALQDLYAANMPRKEEVAALLADLSARRERLERDEPSVLVDDDGSVSQMEEEGGLPAAAAGDDDNMSEGLDDAGLDDTGFDDAGDAGSQQSALADTEPGESASGSGSLGDGSGEPMVGADDEELDDGAAGLDDALDDTVGQDGEGSPLPERELGDGEELDNDGAAAGSDEVLANTAGQDVEDRAESQQDAMDEAGVSNPRGANPPEPDDKLAPRIVGRASERGPRGVELQYYLVTNPPIPKQGRTKRVSRAFEWKRLDDLNAAERAAFELLPLERRGSDPVGDGWVVEITDARDAQDGRQYRVRWFVWREGNSAPLSKRLEWRAQSDFVNPRLGGAFDGTLQQDAGVAEQESDEEEDAGSALRADLMESQGDDSGDQGTAGAPSSLRWDPTLGQPRLSLRAAVRNHVANSEWTVGALKSYVQLRRFVLLSRVPPAPDTPDAPKSAELSQLGEDLLFVREPKLLAAWKRSRLLAKRRRRQQQEAREEEDDEEEDEEDEDEDEDGLDDDDDNAETAWRERTRRTLLSDAEARWSASRLAVDTEMAELDAQWLALQIIDGGAPAIADPAKAARVQQLLEPWRASDPGWPASFSKPRLKLPKIADYLSDGRSQEAERWLLLQREEHSEASENQRKTGIMGSSLGGSWDFSDVPGPSDAPGEHTVPVEWYRPGSALILENGDGRQCPVGIHIATQQENSAKGAKALGTFSQSEADPKRLFQTPLLSDQKRAQLARSTAFAFLAYLGLSNKQSSKGFAPLATSSGVDAYARAWKQNPGFRRLIAARPTEWERRMQLLCLGIGTWQICNPLTLYKDALDDDLAAVLEKRFSGGDDLLKLCDQALVDSVLRAPR